MRNFLIKVFLIIFLLGNTLLMFGQEDSARTIIVGIKEAPPFIMKQKNGDYKGLSIDLWEKVSENLHISYQYKVFDLPGLLKALEEKSIDLCISPLTVTSNRLNFMNFTQPYFISDLGIATHKEQHSTIMLLLSNIFSLEFLKAVSLLLLIITFFGLLFLLAERRANKDQLDKGAKALLNSFWWSAVTMTTVGYGDKYPVTPLGKLVGIIWMFTSVIIISSFTASIASSLTVEQLSFPIKGINDLKEFKIGAVEGSSTVRFLDETGFEYKLVSGAREGLKELKQQQLDVLIYDKPILQYYIASENLGEQIELLPISIKKEFYGFSAPKGSTLIPEVNYTLVKEIESGLWNTLKKRYQLDDY